MAYSKEQRIINSVTNSTAQQRNAPVTNKNTEGFVLANNSGDHQRSIKRNDPINDYDLVNKAYVDTAVAGAGGVAMKQYIGTVSGGGGDFTVSLIGATLSSVTRCVAIPYQTSDGAWRLKFNIKYTLASSDLNYDLNFSGVTYKNVSGFSQVVSIYTSGTQTEVRTATTTSNTGNIRVGDFGGETSASISGDVELDSKPTWAD